MSGPHIMVVEDEQIIADDIRTSLNHLGYKSVDLAATGEEALGLLRTRRPDLVLMDIELRGSGMDGIALADEVREKYSLPVVYLTSHSDAATLSRAKASGPFGYLLKPFDIRDLGTAVDLALYRHDIEARLRDRERRLAAILGSIADAVIVADAGKRVQYLNPAAETLTGWASREAAGRPLGDVLRLVSEATGEPLSPPVSDISAGVLTSRDGLDIPVEATGSPLRTEQGAEAGVVVVFRDVAQQRRALKALEKSERFLNSIFESIDDPFCIFDRGMGIVRANEGYARLKGYEVNDLLGQACYRLFEGRDSSCEECAVTRTFREEEPFTKEKELTLEGRKRWVEISTYPIFNPRGDVTHVVQYTRDISERKRSEEERTRLIRDLEHISRLDGLTGVLNRRALMESLRQEADRSRRYAFPLSVILCDIDRFKDINDTYGHGEGDRALQAVTRTLAGTIRQSDILGRYGGDEFMIILPATSIEGAEEFAERIRRAVRGVHFETAEASPIPLTVSLGVSALGTDEGEDENALVKRADMALYASKREGRDSVSVSRP